MENKDLRKELHYEIINAAHWTNHCAWDKDINRNHVNYGHLTAYLHMFKTMFPSENRTEHAVYRDENDCLRIPHIIIDGVKTELE